MAKTYTLEEARAAVEAKGKQFTPAIEKLMRDQGMIVDAPPLAPKGTVPEWQAALAELIGRATGGMAGGSPLPAEALSAYQRGTYGSSAGDQLGAGVVSGLTARNIDAADMGVAPPTTGIGRFASGFGQGIGMGATMLPIGRGVGMATQGIASPLLRAAATGAAGFGAYEGAAPAESLAERGVNVLKGAGMGAVAGAVPMLPGVRNVMQAAPVLRPALDLATFTGMGGVEGMAQGMPAGEAFRQAFTDAIPMMMGASALHGVAGGGESGFDKKVRETVKSKLEAENKAIADQRAAEEAAKQAELEAMPQYQQGVAARLAAEQYRAANPQEGLPGGHPGGLGKTGAQLEAEQVAPVDGPKYGAEVTAAGRRVLTARQAEAEANALAEEMYAAKFRNDIAAQREKNLQQAAEEHAARMAAAERVKQQTGANRSAAGGTKLYAFGGLEDFGAIRDAFRAAKQGLSDIEARQVQNRADAIVRDIKAGKVTGDLARLAPGYANIADPTDRNGVAGKMMPIEGIPVSALLSQYRNGEMPLEQFVGAIKKNPALITELPPDVQRQFGINTKKQDLRFDQRVRPSPTETEFEPVGFLGRWNKDKTQFMDRARGVRRITGGDFNNPAYKASVRLGQQWELVRDKMNFDLQQRGVKILEDLGFKHDSPDLEIVARLLHGVYDKNWGLETVTKTSLGKALLGKSERPDAVLAAVEKIGNEFKYQADIRDVARRFTGEAPLQRRSVYFPQTERQYDLFARKQQGFGAKAKEVLAAVDQIFGQTDQRLGVDTANPKLYSAREMTRSETSPLREDQINFDLVDVLMKYTLDTTRMFSNSAALTHGENVADGLRMRAKAFSDAGDPTKAEILKGAADAMSSFTQMAYGGKLPGVAGAVRGGMSSLAPTRALLKADDTFKAFFNASRYALNLRFIALTQWTSIAGTAAGGLLTPKEMGEVFKAAASDRIHQEWTEAYSHWAKNRKFGRIANEGSAQSEMLDRKSSPLDYYRRGKMDAFREKTNASKDVPVQFVENAVGRMAFAIAEQLAKKNGLSAEDALAFKSDFVGLTQSYFDRVNRASILSTPVLNTLFPAQGYSFDAAHGVNDILSGTSGPKRQMNKAARAGRLGAYLASLWAFQMFQTVFMTKNEDAKDIALENTLNTGATLLPYNSLFLPALRKATGAQVGQTYYSRMADDEARAMKDIAEGNVADGLTRLGTLFTPGGTQIRRVFDAHQKYEQGVIREDELSKAYILGWDNTESGKRFIRTQSGKDTAKDRAYRPTPDQDRRSEDYRYQQSIKAEEKAAKKQAERDKQDEEYYRRGGR